MFKPSKRLIKASNMTGENLAKLVAQLQAKFYIDQTLATVIAGSLIEEVANQVEDDEDLQATIKELIQEKFKGFSNDSNK